MLTEPQTRIAIAYDVLLTCAVIVHNGEELTDEQKKLLNRIVDDLDHLKNEVRA